MASSPAYRLPGLGHSLWIGSIATPPALKLPGAGFSLWQSVSKDHLEGASVRLTASKLSLPGQGQSVWLGSKFPQHASGASAMASLVGKSITSPTGPPATGLSLPGNGFSKWSHPNKDLSSVRLPGGSHTLWASKPQDATGHAASSEKTSSHFTTNVQQPSLFAKIMKSFGLAQLLGLLLIIALLLGFLGSRKEADKLNQKLATVETDLKTTQEDRTAYLDQVNALKGQAETSAKTQEELASKVDALGKEKTGIENTLKTQIANLEKASKAADDAKAAVESNLKEVSASNAANEQQLKAAQENLKSSKDEILKLNASIKELTDAKSDIEAKLSSSVEALEKTKEEAGELKSQLDQSEKSKSDLQKKVDELKKSLKEAESKAKASEEASEATKEEVSSLQQEASRLKAALAKNESALAEFKSVIDNAQPVQQDNTVASAAALREEDLLNLLSKERQEKQEVAKFLKELQSKVKQIQGDLHSANL